MADIKYVITADSKGAVTSIKKVETATKGMKDQATKAKKPLGGMFAKLAAGAAVALAARAAIRGLVRFMKDAVIKAAEQEAAEKLLNDALESTGRVVSEMLPSMIAYAGELQKQTTYGDEAIIAAEALMVQLTDLDEKGLKAATRGALGMATVFKTDLKSASVLIAKALAGNFGALSRYGFMVDKNLTLEEKRIDLLGQLETLYKTAKGETETYAGKVKQLGNAYGDLKEEIGKAITENENILELIDTTKEKIVDLIESGAIEDAVYDITLYFSALGEALDTLGEIVKLHPLNTLVLIINDLTGATDDADEAMGDFYLTTKGLYEPTDRLKGLLENLGGKFLPKAAEETKKFSDNLATTKTKISTLPPPIGAVERAVKKLLEKFDDLMEPEDVKIWVAEWESQGTALKSVLSGIGLHVAGIHDDIAEDAEETVEEINQYWDTLTTDLGRSWGALFLDLTDKNSTFEESFENFGRNLVDSFRATIADMISDWMTGFIQGLIDSSETAGEQIAENIAKPIGGAKSDSVADAFDSVGGAASGLLNTLSGVANIVTAIASVVALFKKTGPSSTDSWNFEHIQINTKEIRDYLFLVQRNWLTKEIPERISRGNAKIDRTNSILRDIRGNTADMVKGLGTIPSGQHGLDFASGPSGGLVRYHPNERVTVAPNISVQPSPVNVNMQSTPVNIYLDSKLLAQGIAKHVPGLSKDGHWKMHQRGLVGN